MSQTKMPLPLDREKIMALREDGALLVWYEDDDDNDEVRLALCDLALKGLESLQTALPEATTTWEPCSAEDERFKHAGFVVYDEKWISTVRSNGKGYDHFVAPSPEFKPREPQERSQ